MIEMVDTTQQNKPKPKLSHKRTQILPLASIVGPAIFNALLVGFLAFLRFGGERTPAWKVIVATERVTQSVSITSLLIHFMVGTQASVSAAMLAALMLETSQGIRLSDVARMSILRYRASPWAMMRPVACGLSCRRRAFQVLRFPVLLLLLLITSTGLQFSSTVLLSDLRLRSLSGFTEKHHLPLDFSYSCTPSTMNCRDVWFNQIPRGTAWTVNPSSYPTFGEYTEPPAQSTQDDTGVVLRAFLPMADAESRQTVRNYTGTALVLDARVSCQAPAFDNLTLSAPFYGNISGTVTNSTASPRLQTIIPTKFLCTFAGPSQRSICQIGIDYAFLYIGSLESQFRSGNSTYGTAFLVIDPTGDVVSQKTLATSDLSSSSAAKSTRGSWTDVSHPSAESTISISLCFAPWDAGRLDINMYSSQNRTEPSPHWTAPTGTSDVGGFDMDPVLDQFGLHSDPANTVMLSTSEARGVLTLDKPASFAPPPLSPSSSATDALPRDQRPFIQADMSAAGGSSSGIRVPLAGNWTTFLCGHPLDTLLNNFTYTPANILAADPAVSSLFNTALARTNGSSAARALAAVITVLSTTAYYGQLPAFDHVPRQGVEQVYFRTVLMPVRAGGFATLVWLLAAHTVLVSGVMVIFERRAGASLLGEAWACVAQVQGVVAGVHGGAGGRGGLRGEVVGGMDDGEVERVLRMQGRGRVKARIVGGRGIDGRGMWEIKEVEERPF